MDRLIGARRQQGRRVTAGHRGRSRASVRQLQSGPRSRSSRRGSAARPVVGLGSGRGSDRLGHRSAARRSTRSSESSTRPRSASGRARRGSTSSSRTRPRCHASRPTARRPESAGAAAQRKRRRRRRANEATRSSAGRRTGAPLLGRHPGYAGPRSRVRGGALRRHPLGRGPALELGDGPTIFESAAISMALADSDAAAPLIGPLGSSERALVYQWVMFALAELQAPLFRWILEFGEGTTESCGARPLHGCRSDGGVRG